MESKKLLRTTLFLMVGCAATIFAQDGSQASDIAIYNSTSGRLDEYLQAQVKVNKFTGTVIVARDGRALLAKGYGYADFDQQSQNTVRTKFRIGSISKLFTATVVMRLRDQRILNLNDPICAHIHPCPITWEAVTIHHLLTHTSGIPKIEVESDRPPTEVPAWSQERLDSAFGDVPLEFSPGEQWQYSDWGYVVLGYVIENVTGESYETVVQDEIFAPLGMENSGFERPNETLIQGASGYRMKDGVLVTADDIDMARPFSAGGLYSTAEDLYKWDRALYSDSVLSQQTLKHMSSLVSKYYAYGWLVSDPLRLLDPFPPWAIPGRLQMGHPGRINGFSSDYLRFPNDHTAVIVLSNNEDLGMVGPALAAIVFGEEYSLPE